jgi:hypothetical protein
VRTPAPHGATIPGQLSSAPVTPDVPAAEKYAKQALELVPHWHYVRDILMAQIHSAQEKD